MVLYTQCNSTQQREWNLVICNNIVGPWGYYAKEISHTDEDIHNFSLCGHFFKKGTEQTKFIEKRLMFSRRKESWKAGKWVKGSKRYNVQI